MRRRCDGAALGGERYLVSSSCVRRLNPVIRVQTVADMAEDEQEGIKLIFIGAMQGIRNLGAHDFPALNRELAAEYLAFASLLLRRVDAARTAGGPAGEDAKRRT